MAFEYGEQKDSNGKITHAGSWGIGSTPKAAFEKIIENFRVLKDEGATIEEVVAALAKAKLYTDGAVATLVSTAPEALDTLYELSNALGNDPNFSTTVMSQIGTKATKATTLAGYGITDAYTRPQVDASFAPAGYGLGTSCKEVTGDWNKILITGFYQGNNLTNAPTNGEHHWYFVQVHRHLDTYIGQIAIGFGSSSSKMWFRRQNIGAWTAWSEISMSNHAHSFFHGIPDTRSVGT